MRTILIGLMILSLGGQPLAAQTVDLTELHQLSASDGVAGDEFGSSVAVQGNLVVVGAYKGDVNDSNSGAAYVFRVEGQSGTLSEIAKLVVSDGTVNDWLGYSVAIDGDTIVVGASKAYTSNYLGRAYVYQEPEGGWAGLIAESAQLRASNRGSRDEFGHSVAIDNGTIVVGAYGEDEAGGQAGALYVFEEPLGGWNGILEEDAKLIPSFDPGNNGYLGWSVDIDGDVVVSGLHLGIVGDNDDQGRGMVFVKPESGWSGTLTETAELFASDGRRLDYLGRGVAISGATVALGASGWEPEGSNTGNGGAVYIFEEPPGGWSGALFESAQLLSSDPVSSEKLGFKVAMDGNTVVAATDKDGTDARESVYVFTRPAGGWQGIITETQRLTDDVDGNNSYGRRVAIHGGLVVAGAQLDDGVDDDAGRAYVYVNEAVFSDSFED